MPPCQGGDRGFESRRFRFDNKGVGDTPDAFCFLLPPSPLNPLSVALCLRAPQVERGLLRAILNPFSFSNFSQKDRKTQILSEIHPSPLEGEGQGVRGAKKSTRLTARGCGGIPPTPPLEGALRAPRATESQSPETRLRRFRGQRRHRGRQHQPHTINEASEVRTGGAAARRGGRSPVAVERTATQHPRIRRTHVHF